MQSHPTFEAQVYAMERKLYGALDSLIQNHGDLLFLGLAFLCLLTVVWVINRNRGCAKPRTLVGIYLAGLPGIPFSYPPKKDEPIGIEQSEPFGD